MFQATRFQPPRARRFGTGYGAKVALVERGATWDDKTGRRASPGPGGTCVNVGCVPQLGGSIGSDGRSRKETFFFGGGLKGKSKGKRPFVGFVYFEANPSRGDLGTWGLGDLGTWGLGDLGTWGLGDLGTWGLGTLHVRSGLFYTNSILEYEAIWFNSSHDLILSIAGLLKPL